MPKKEPYIPRISQEQEISADPIILTVQKAVVNLFHELCKEFRLESSHIYCFKLKRDSIIRMWYSGKDVYCFDLYYWYSKNNNLQLATLFIRYDRGDIYLIAGKEGVEGQRKATNITQENWLARLKQYCSFSIRKGKCNV